MICNGGNPPQVLGNKYCLTLMIKAVSQRKSSDPTKMTNQKNGGEALSNPTAPRALLGWKLKRPWRTILLNIVLLNLGLIVYECW